MEKWNSQESIDFSIKWSEDAKSKGIVEIRGAWIDGDKKFMWCYWETDNLEALQAAFDEMNKVTGLVYELSLIDGFFPT